MAGLDPEIVAALVATAFCAGFIDAIAGGGGLITVPALALAGLDPVSAIATNKLQASFGSGSATFAFWRAGHLQWREVRSIVLLAACGSVGGALLLTSLPKAAINVALPIVLIVVAVYFALSPRMSDAQARPRMSEAAFLATVVPMVGFYDGAFGPGTGSFYMLGFISLLGCGVLRATARTKAANFASNFAGLLPLSFSGQIVWGVGLAMGVAQLLGARLGAQTAIRSGARLIRPLIVSVCLALALRLAFDQMSGLTDGVSTFWRMGLSQR